MYLRLAPVLCRRKGLHNHNGVIHSIAVFADLVKARTIDAEATTAQDTPRIQLRAPPWHHLALTRQLAAN